MTASPDAAADSATWWKRAVFYQIYPRSFFDTNGDGIGDLPGVRAKLPYIADLGVDAIWLSPFFTSPMKDFGYDVSDYRGVDPTFGSLEDFDALVADAHALGLKVIIDQVWSHTSDRHPWFLESSGSSRSKKADWYVWADAHADGTPPNNWQACFGGPAWSWSPRRRQYYLHNFLEGQPDLNFWNRHVQDAVLDVARFWLDRGVDGFRLDAVNYLFHDAGLRDNPPAAWRSTPQTTHKFQQHIYERTRPETLSFITRLRALMDTYDDRMAVGEIFDSSPLKTQRAYTADPTLLHSAYNFYLLDAKRADPDLFEAVIMGWRRRKGWPSWSLSNHDVPRFPSRLSPAGPLDERRTRVLLAILLSLPGTPYLYQGDELGLPQAEIPFDKLQDPYAIAAYTGSAGRDGARTPMPWSHAAPNAGFSSAKDPWLPVDPRHRTLAVDLQEGREDSTLEFVRRFLALRRRRPELQLGKGDFLDRARRPPSNVLAFARQHEDRRTVCLFELAGRETRVPFEGVCDLIDAGMGGRLEAGEVVLPPFGAAFLSMRDLPTGESPLRALAEAEAD
ncbi:alpha-amylase family glycosyl hydrolase [Phenylobacterium sp.]|uniref:alpha-amylase family glycosyl hydrolase n=1 Tax=Phenylobacterium sp. TaxID=1871053 RepID=UPI0035AED9FE